jgi:ankyrin repeat protein
MQTQNVIIRKSLLIFSFAFTIWTHSAQAQINSKAIEIIRKNEVAVAKTYFDKSNANELDKEGDNLLMNAALYGSSEMMEILLKKGANPNLKNTDGETALMWSLHDIEKTKLLLRYNADINVKSRSGNSALLIACVGAHQYEIVKLLIDNGANVLEKNGKKETALGRAAIFGDSTTLALLLSNGIDIEAGDATGLSPLIQAIFNVNREGTIFLLNNGADPDRVRAFGLTAVTAAVTLNDLESIHEILKRTKNINTVDTEGISALMWAAYNEHDNTDIIQALLDRGADVNIKSKKGQNALSWAMLKGNTRTVALLKKAGAKLN